MPSASGCIGITVTLQADSLVRAGHSALSVVASARIASGATCCAVPVPIAFGGPR